MPDSLRHTIKEMRTLREELPFPVKLYISSSLETGGESVETAVRAAVNTINQIENLRNSSGKSWYQVGVGVLFIGEPAVSKENSILLGMHRDVSSITDGLTLLACYAGKVSYALPSLQPQHLLIFAEEERFRIACKGDLERYLGMRVM